MELIDILYILPAVVIAITFHEYAHAKVAIKLGDDTPKLQGRDTINPLTHIDIFGLICLMLAHFGWGRPVQIDPRNFKKPLKGQMLVSLAGPVMNLIIAFVSLIIHYVLLISGALTVFSANTAEAIIGVVDGIVLINISLCIFNLLPLPNFDGSKILLYFLPNKWKFKFLGLEKYSFLILLLIILTPIPEYIITPILMSVLNGMQYLIELVLALFGII